MTHTNRIKNIKHAGVFQQKKELLIAVFVLFNLSVFAQVIEIKGVEVEIDSVLSGSSSYEITARDNITLSPGFSFTPSQGCSLLTEIDPFYTEPVDTGNITGGPGGDIGELVGDEGVVGAIPGTFAASPSGAATYTIPIECPAGVNGITPKLTLSYNSQASNGIAGWGWNISGVSAISRVPKTIYYDDEAKQIQWDNTDVFALDGQRLIEVNDYTDSIEYRLENDPKPKIMGYDYTDEGPGWFKVWDGKGNIYYYSDKNRMRNKTQYIHYEEYCPPIDIIEDTVIKTNIVQSFSLKRQQDILDNFIDYTYGYDSTYVTADSFYYYEDENSCYIDYSELNVFTTYKNYRLMEVSYGNSENTLYTVVFTYSDRDDSIHGYIAGERYFNAKVLNEISVKYGGVTGNEMKNYSLTYDNQEYSYLQSVELSGLNEEKYNKTVFEWEENDYDINQSTYFTYDLPGFYSDWESEGYSYFRQHYYCADFNNDGISDFFVYFALKKDDSYKYGWAIYLNPGSPTNLSVTGSGIFPDSRAFYFIDTDLDGKDELYLQYPYSIYNNPYVKFYCYEYSDSTETMLRTDEKDFYMRLWNDATFNGVHLVTADFEGDGKPDYLLLKNSNNNYVNSEDFYYCTNADFGNTTKYQLLDFNGNGKTDIMFLHNDKAEIWEYNKTPGKFVKILTSTLFNKDDILIIGDYNSDGNSDIIYKKKNIHEWEILISDGKNLLQNELIPPALDTYYQEDDGYGNEVCYYCSFDINYDGKTDIIEWNEVLGGPSHWRIFIQNGNGFEMEDTAHIQSYLSGPMVIMRTGNGNNDLTTDAFITQIYPQYLKISPDIDFNTIKRIFNGTGNLLEITYGKVQNPYKNCEAKKEYLGSSLPTVISLITALRTVKQIENEISKTIFSFGNPLIHTNGKGFLGYGITNVEKFIDSTIVSSTIQIQKLILTGYGQKYGLFPDTVINKVNGRETSLTAMNYSSKVINLNYYVIPDNIISENKITNSKSIQYFQDYNNDLLPLTTYTRYYQDSEELIAVDSAVTTYTNIISGDKRIIGLPDSVIIYKKRPEETDFVRKTNFEYYSIGMLKFKFEEKYTPKELKEEYVYDTYGNTITRKISAPNESGAPLREQNFTYNADGYHLESKQDALDYEESYTYYTENGLLKTVTDEENDLTTEYEYDGFGRQIKVTHPDGNEEYTGLRWATDHPDAPDSSLYYSYQQSSGNPPALVFYDKFDRELRSVSTGFDGEEIYKDTKYNVRSQVDSVSLPYESSGNTYWTTFEYDTLNRVSREDYPDERFTEYDYDERTTTATTGRGSDTRQSVQTVNGLGEVITSTDNADNTVETTYYASGLPKEKKVSGVYSTLLSYDIYGNRDTISDPDAGTIASQYNVFGELISQTDALGNKTSYTYDDLGRVLTEKQYAPGDVLKNTKTYVYDTRFTGALSTVIQDSAQNTMEYYYDDNGFGRLVRTVETYDGLTIENKFTHDAYGRLVIREYPSGFKVSQSYNVNGYLKSIKGNNKTLWECLDMNPLGQITFHKQGSYTSQTGYDAYGELQSQTFANGRGMNYGFDNKGNMSYREDIHKNLKETFGYDELDRLNRIAYYVNGNHQVYLDRHILYDESGIGNISSITGVGSDFNYGENDAGPHALTSVSRPEPGWRPGPQEIEYTTFNKVSSVVDTVEGGKPISWEIYYGLDDQRRKSVYKDSGQIIRTRYYFGDYERIYENSTINNYHYISSPTGLCAIFVTEGSATQGQLWHTYTDHLGSLVYMVNADNSNDYKEYSFDAWGNPRDAADWTDTLSEPLFGGRGFTGHEHLEEFALINMNGRIYDPMLGRFFSPDTYVQLPGYAGSYNRYSYCLNNPLVYTDPDGEFFWFVLGGAIIGGWIGASTTAEKGFSLNPKKWGDDWWKGAIVGGIAGAGIGALIAPMILPTGAGSLFTTATGTPTLGWQLTSSALTSANLNMAFTGISSNFEIDAMKTSGLSGLLSGIFTGGTNFLIDNAKHSIGFLEGALIHGGTRGAYNYIEGLSKHLEGQELWDYTKKGVLFSAISGGLNEGFQAAYDGKSFLTGDFIRPSRTEQIFNGASPRPMLGKYSFKYPQISRIKQRCYPFWDNPIDLDVQSWSAYRCPSYYAFIFGRYHTIFKTLPKFRINWLNFK